MSCAADYSRVTGCGHILHTGGSQLGAGGSQLGAGGIIPSGDAPTQHLVSGGRRAQQFNASEPRQPGGAGGYRRGSRLTPQARPHGADGRTDGGRTVTARAELSQLTAHQPRGPCFRVSNSTNNFRKTVANAISLSGVVYPPKTGELLAPVPV